VQHLLDQWIELADTPDAEQRAERLNKLLAEGSTYPRIVRHRTGPAWHLHYRDDAVPLATVLYSLITVGTALHLTGRGMRRLSRCGAEDCSRIFADISPTGRQRYCRNSCANRSAVRRHRRSKGRSEIIYTTIAE